MGVPACSSYLLAQIYVGLMCFVMYTNNILLLCHEDNETDESVGTLKSVSGISSSACGFASSPTNPI